VREGSANRPGAHSPNGGATPPPIAGFATARSAVRPVRLTRVRLLSGVDGKLARAIE